FATVGTVRQENCHPFSGTDDSGREWTMCHNGTIFQGSYHHYYAVKQQGDTDSERFFLALLEEINHQLASGIPTMRERFEMVSRFIVNHAPRNKLNLLLYDGELLYVHKNLKNTLYFKQLETGLVFATKPLDKGNWLSFPMAQVIAYQNGREIFRGNRHKGIFIPSLDYITVNDAMYI
ncbi:MAG: class II glutamine amidotransferase, partial [Oscillospiraceae bacterium]